jgi:ABC-type transporter Mla subunit MlaD
MIGPVEVLLWLLVVFVAAVVLFTVLLVVAVIGAMIRRPKQTERTHTTDILGGDS